MKRIFFVMSAAMLLNALSIVSAYAQNTDSYDEFRKRQQAEFGKFRQNTQDEYDAYRKRLNEQYAEFMRRTWDAFPAHEADEPQPETPVQPVVYNEPEPAPQPVVEPDQQPAPQPAPEPKEIPVEPAVVVVPEPAPAPEPIAPVKPKEEQPQKRVSVGFYGSIVSLSFPANDNLKIKSLDENSLADAWKTLSSSRYDITVKTALDVRKASDLCDWAYMDMLRAVTEKRYGKTNEAVLMQAYIMSQSGYRVRLGMTKNKLHMLIASRYEIYGMRYVTLDGTKFYITGDRDDKELQICKAQFDKEQSLSLQMARLPKFGNEPTPKRTLTSRKGVTATVSVNKNLIDFMNTYPQACINGDAGTRWAAYANTPLDKNVKDALYPVLKKTIAGMPERDAVGILLNWVQTAFKYGYDDQIWGGDRPFFAQETLYYPQSDCEDRAILFSRLVRDLVGLDVVLLYYPGHLATAVAFSGEQKGDWLTYKGRKFIVCDPTYENAPVGATMPGMDNKKAKMIALK